VHRLAPYRYDPAAAEALERRAQTVCMQARGVTPPPHFTTDGCSMWPDDGWVRCCVEHDVAYWCGGTSAPHAGRRNVPRLRVRSARRAHGVAHVRGRPRGWSAVGTVPVALGLWLGPLPLKRTDRVPRDGCAALQRCPFDVVECGRDRRERDRPGGARPDEPCRTMAGAWLGATLASQWHERTRTGRGRPRICPHGSARAVPDGINATARRTLRYTRMMPRRA
jgi:hypothetical protein